MLQQGVTPERQGLHSSAQMHGFVAAGAGALGDFHRRRYWRWGCAEDLAQALEFVFGCGTQKAVVPEAHEAFGQDVLTPSSQEWIQSPA